MTGSASAIGGELTSNPLVRKITFTGSTPIGKLLVEQSAKTLKKVSMELGGNAPFIVFDDADVDRAIEGALIAKYRNSGQTCVCTNRFLVQAGIHDLFVGKLAAVSEGLKVGNGMEPGVQQGPLIDMKAVEKVEEHINDALSKGAKLVAGGKRHKLGGTFFQPTVLDRRHASDDGRARRNFRSAIAGLQIRDRSTGGGDGQRHGVRPRLLLLHKGFGRAFRVAEALKYGMVGINEGLITTEVAPFGGVKESGMGKKAPNTASRIISTANMSASADSTEG